MKQSEANLTTGDEKRSLVPSFQLNSASSILHNCIKENYVKANSKRRYWIAWRENSTQAWRYARLIAATATAQSVTVSIEAVGWFLTVSWSHHLIVLLRLGWLTVLSSMNMVEQELYFLERGPGDTWGRIANHSKHAGGGRGHAAAGYPGELWCQPTTRTPKYQSQWAIFSWEEKNAMDTVDQDYQQYGKDALGWAHKKPSDYNRWKANPKASSIPKPFVLFQFQKDL